MSDSEAYAEYEVCVDFSWEATLFMSFSIPQMGFKVKFWGYIEHQCGMQPSALPNRCYNGTSKNEKENGVLWIYIYETLMLIGLGVDCGQHFKHRIIWMYMISVEHHKMYNLV